MNRDTITQLEQLGICVVIKEKRPNQTEPTFIEVYRLDTKTKVHKDASVN